MTWAGAYWLEHNAAEQNVAVLADTKLPTSQQLALAAKAASRLW